MEAQEEKNVFMSKQEIIIVIQKPEITIVILTVNKKSLKLFQQQKIKQAL